MFARRFASVFTRTLTQRTLSSSAKTHSSSSLLATVAALGAAAAYAASDKSTAHASGDTLPLPECVQPLAAINPFLHPSYAWPPAYFIVAGILLTTTVCSVRTTQAAFAAAFR